MAVVQRCAHSPDSHAGAGTHQAGGGKVEPPERNSFFEIIFLAVAAGFVYLAAVLHSRTLLAVATIAVLAYTAWFSGKHFGESIGWPILLIFLGMFMIGLSALAFRIDRDYVRRKSTA